MLSVKNNLAAVTARTQLLVNQKKNAKTMERLSSGYRINRAADDAAGLTISEGMRCQIRGLNRASHNIQEGISLIQVADGAMNEISDMLHRMKELSIQSANATNTWEDRSNIQKEIDSLLLEIDDIHEKAQFNEIRVLDGAARTVGGGTSSSGHYGSGYYVKGGLPDWVTRASGTTKFGYLSAKTSIAHWEMGCTEVRDASGNPVTGSAVIDAATGYIYQAGTTVRVPAFLGIQQSIRGMDTLGVANGSTDSLTITATDGKKYTVTRRYSHGFETYASAFLDFRNANASNIKELAGNGFFTTCTMCDKRYSIEFVDGTGDGRRYAGTGSNDYIYAVDIHGITNKDDLIDKIISVLGDSRWNGMAEQKYNVKGTGAYLTSAKPNRHYSSFAAELNPDGTRTGRLMIISTGEDRGSFVNPTYFPDYGLFHSGVYTYGDNVWIPDPPDPAAKLQGELHIQTGAKKGDAVLIGLPVINCQTLGLMSFSVLTEYDAGEGISLADEALELLSTERSNLGAWQNRLEHAYANVTHTSENTQAAESRIRDCKMADAVVKNSICQILMQAGISVLAQANQQPQMLLQMLP